MSGMPVAIREPGAESDWDFSVRMLEAVSRTFSRPIMLLPPGLREAVTCGYLLCRIADTIEDQPGVPVTVRDLLFERYLALLEHNARPESFAEAASVLAADDAETELARNAPRVWRVLATLPESQQLLLKCWTSEMTRGMNLYARRSPGDDGIRALMTIGDLERYCYFVAGTVGHLLTDLFLIEFKALTPERATTLRGHAEGFGVGLQLVNIIKDITDDITRGWTFVPRQLLAVHGLAPGDLADAQRMGQAPGVLDPLFRMARERLDEALRYTLAVPPQATQVRLFCLLPLWMAVRTLVHAEGNANVHRPGAPVKISRGEVEALIQDAMGVAGDDQAIELRYAALWRSPATVEA